MTGAPLNILLVLTDQQRADTVAALGNPVIRTPTLDQLCREGVAFTHAVTPSPVCVAARCAVFTGQPPHVTGCADNMAMPRDGRMIQHRLAERGYQTHSVGKMHFTPRGYDAWGFESRDTSEELAGPPDDYMAFLRARGYGHVLEPHGVRSEYYYIPQPAQLPAELHHTAWTANRSIDFLRRRDRSRPFFLVTSFIKPHPPFETPLPWSKLYRAHHMPEPRRAPGDEALWTYWNRVQNRYKCTDGGNDRRLAQARRAAYYATISFLDYHLGRVLHALAADAEQTLVLFTSDHGEMLGDYGCWGKRCMLNPSVRVPLIARFPHRRHAGARVDTPTTLLDLAPTILSAAGIEQPRVHLEGMDLAELTHGDAPGDRIVFSQYQLARYGLYMAENRHGKLIRSTADQRTWLLRRGQGGGEADVTSDAVFRPLGRALDEALRQRFAADRHTDAVGPDGGWVRYDPVVFPDDPDAGLLSQDPPELQAMLRQLPPGYVGPAAEPVRGDPLRAIDPRAGASSGSRHRATARVEVQVHAPAGSPAPPSAEPV